MGLGTEAERRGEEGNGEPGWRGGRWAPPGRKGTVTQPEPCLGRRRSEADSGSAAVLLCDLGLPTTSLWASLPW